LSADIPELTAKYLAPTYKRAPLTFERGEGVYLYDSAGREYLDMAAGIAVNALGYEHPALREELSKPGLIHITNLYHSAPQAQLAEALCGASFADKVFLCNSGTEANEGAMKFARKVRPGDFVAFSDSFHGRTMGALSVTANPAYREPFEPLIGGVRFATYNDLSSVQVDAAVSAVIVEPVQGEGGVRAASPEFLQGLRQLCDAAGALLIFDEVQCGVGRTGSLWAYQSYGVEPDLLTAAKPLGGGLPIGAILMNERVGKALAPGDHGSTFGGGPLVCRVAQRVLSIVNQPEFLSHVLQTGKVLGESLELLAKDFPVIREVRGRGLMWGVALDASVAVSKLVEAGYGHGLVMLSSGGNTLRLVPPLIVRPEHIVQFATRLRMALLEVAVEVA
jgi:acetylornithine/N-succinyldiaminopimelate aminotransferase